MKNVHFDKIFANSPLEKVNILFNINNEDTAMA